MNNAIIVVAMKLPINNPLLWINTRITTINMVSIARVNQ